MNGLEALLKAKNDGIKVYSPTEIAISLFKYYYWDQAGFRFCCATKHNEEILCRETANSFMRFDDWQVYEEPGHNLVWAIEQILEGNLVTRKSRPNYVWEKLDFKDGFYAEDLDVDDWILYV